MSCCYLSLNQTALIVFLSLSQDDGMLSTSPSEKSWTILFKIFLHHCALAYSLICTVSVCAQGNRRMQTVDQSGTAKIFGIPEFFLLVVHPVTVQSYFVIVVPLVRSISSHMDVVDVVCFLAKLSNFTSTKILLLPNCFQTTVCPHCPVKVSLSKIEHLPCSLNQSHIVECAYTLKHQLMVQHCQSAVR